MVRWCVLFLTLVACTNETESGEDAAADVSGDGTAAGDTANDTEASSTAGSESSSGGAACQPDGCTVDEDCPESGQTCVDCTCIPVDPGIGDPSYPDRAGGCAGTLDGNTAVNPPLNICVPSCDTTAADFDLACPDPLTGTAVGQCLVTSSMGSSGAGCSMETFGEACEADGEYCYSNGGGDFSCRFGLYCLLSCADDEVCPDMMSCNADGRCEY